MSESDFVLNAGDVVAGKYVIVDALGVGGSGAVYRAQKKGMSLQVALKIMHAEHPDGSTERQRFAREAELVKRLQHPNIVRLIDYGYSDDRVPFLVFSLLEGVELEERLRSGGPLSWELVGRFATQTLRALDKAHSLGIVHRDIKPANIFLASGVLGEMVQILDFGLAKLVHDAPDAMDVTRVGSVMGTPRYMAPEQVRGEQVGATADIYAFGLVMCEMLLGHPLVQGKTELELYVAQGSDTPHELPEEILMSPFGSIIQRAIAKTLNVRYRQASQMLADVKAVVEVMGGGEKILTEADMEATQLMDPSVLQRLSTPTASSEKLRSAFNAMAARTALNTAQSGAAAAQPSAPAPARGAQAARPTPPAAAHPAAQATRPHVHAATPPPPPSRGPRHATPAPQPAAAVRHATPAPHPAAAVRHPTPAPHPAAAVRHPTPAPRPAAAAAPPAAKRRKARRPAPPSDAAEAHVTTLPTSRPPPPITSASKVVVNESAAQSMRSPSSGPLSSGPLPRRSPSGTFPGVASGPHSGPMSGPHSGPMSGPRSGPMSGGPSGQIMAAQAGMAASAPAPSADLIPGSLEHDLASTLNSPSGIPAAVRVVDTRAQTQKNTLIVVAAVVVVLLLACAGAWFFLWR